MRKVRWTIVVAAVAACSNEPPPMFEKSAEAATGSSAGEATKHGGKAGAAATRLAKFYEDKEGKPCRVYAAGEQIEFGDFSYRFDAPLLAEPETRLPWIANIEERTALSRKSMKALILRASVQNHTPVVQRNPGGMRLIASDGSQPDGWWYNANVWLKANNAAPAAQQRVEWPSSFKPDTWYHTVSLYSATEAQSNGALLYFIAEKRWRDANGTRHRVLIDHAVAELAPPVATEPIRGRR